MLHPSNRNMSFLIGLCLLGVCFVSTVTSTCHVPLHVPTLSILYRLHLGPNVLGVLAQRSTVRFLCCVAVAVIPSTGGCGLGNTLHLCVALAGSQAMVCVV